MSKFVYEQSFTITLKSKLHITDEFKETFNMDTLSRYFGNEFEIVDVQHALNDPLKAATLDHKEILCALAICDDQPYYNLRKPSGSHSGNSVTIDDDIVDINVTCIYGVYHFDTYLSITTVFDKQLTVEDVKSWLPQIAVKYGEVTVVENGDAIVTDSSKTFDDTKAYCSLATRTYFDSISEDILEIPDRLNVTILGYRSNAIVNVFTYHRDLYDECVTKLADDECRNAHVLATDNPLLAFFDYGYEHEDWENDTYFVDSIVKRNDGLTASEFCNEYLNTCTNLDVDDTVIQFLDEGDEFGRGMVWTEERLDNVMSKFGFIKD